MYSPTNDDYCEPARLRYDAHREEIGCYIASHAKIASLGMLLRDLHALVGKLLDVRNFMAVLVDIPVK